MRRGLFTRSALGAAVALVALAASGCGDDRGLEAHRAKWQKLAAPSYKFQLKWSCFCPPDITDPVEIQVKSGAIVSVKNVATGQMVALSPTAPNQRTIDGLMTWLDEALKRGPDEMKVMWDEMYGYPRNVSVDFVKNASDDEQAFTVSNFTLTP